MAQFLGYSTFLERLGEEASRDRGEGVLGLAVINLEFISRVDGSYGYEVGDRILRTLALRLRDALPEGDLIGEVVLRRMRSAISYQFLYSGRQAHSSDARDELQLI